MESKYKIDFLKKVICIINYSFAHRYNIKMESESLTSQTRAFLINYRLIFEHSRVNKLVFVKDDKSETEIRKEEWHDEMVGKAALFFEKNGITPCSLSVKSATAFDEADGKRVMVLVF